MRSQGSTVTSVTMNGSGWVAIPKEFLVKYGFKPGGKVAFVDYGGLSAILPVPDDPVAGGLGVLKPFVAERPLTEALLRERSVDREAEENAIERYGHP